MRTTARVVGVAALGVAVLGYIAVVLCLYRAWDAVAAITVFPIWAWALGGLALCVIAGITLRWKIVYAVALLWFLTGVIGSDERRSLFRGLSPSLAEGRLRVRKMEAGCCGS